MAMDPLHRMAMRLRHDLDVQADIEKIAFEDFELAVYIKQYPDFAQAIECQLAHIFLAAIKIGE